MKPSSCWWCRHIIDVVIVSKLLIMVIVGGYETFVSRMDLDNHPDQPEWLDHVNASVLKVKLATAIIDISFIHLLKTFINAANYDLKVLMWQTHHPRGVFAERHRLHRQIAQQLARCCQALTVISCPQLLKGIPGFGCQADAVRGA